MDTEQYSDPEFCIGEPYLYQPVISFYEQIIRILFFYADPDGDDCVTKDEFFAIVGQARAGMPAFLDYLTQFFNFCDADGTGILTWYELNDCIATTPEFSGDDEIEMAQVLF